MASTSETGHAKNVANFGTLISFCGGYGASYNPSKTALQLSGLAAIKTEADKKLQDVKVAKSTFDNVVNARQTAFKQLQPLATRIINALAASGASPLVVVDAKAIIRKLRGVRATSIDSSSNGTPDNPGPTPDKKISTAQTSYDSLVDHFAKLIELLSQQTEYKPNETELTTAKLTDLISDMQTANAGVVNAYTAWSNTRIERNKVLYNPLAGLVQTAQDIKLYVKSVYGATSPQYKQVSKLQFREVPN
jgi:hypothetical protein